MRFAACIVTLAKNAGVDPETANGITENLMSYHIIN
jgi:hypothetical protein